MDPGIKEEIRHLSERLMAYAAREIYVSNSVKNPKKAPDRRKYQTNDDVVKRLNELIKTNEDLELVKTASLEYLALQIQIAKKNPSFRILRKRIRSGKYDFYTTLNLSQKLSQSDM